MYLPFYQRSESSNPPLRIGLLLDSAVLPSFFAEVVDHIQQSNFARIELLVLNADTQRVEAAPPPARSLYKKIAGRLGNGNDRKRLLFDLYQRFDQRRFQIPHDPFVDIDCSERFAGIDQISVTPITKRFVHRFPPEIIESIREKRLDVLIRFGFNILRGEILTSAKYGVWSYHHGDNDYYRGGPAQFWEVYEGSPTSGVILQILTEELDAGKVLYKGLFATEPGFSHVLNRVQPFWGASSFMIQKLHELHEYGWEHVERTCVSPAPYRGRKKIYTVPSNGEMVRWLGPLFAEKALRRLTDRPAIDHWRLAIRSRSNSIADSKADPDLNGFHWIEAPKGRFYADPFLIEESGKTWLYFEDYDYGTQHGRISCAEVRDGAIANPVVALERPYHLSYPCIFRDRDALYMIPESVSNGAIELYRCVRFPDQWVLEKELWKAHGVDTTVWIEDGRYWLFTTMQEQRGDGIQLWLFYATSLTGEWTPHPANPISTDVRNARGAGAIFRRDGKLFRPSQDCSKHYGHSFTLNEITVLDRSRYQETPAITVGPSWAPGLVATHSYSHTAQVEVIDGCTTLPKGRVLGRD